MKKLFAVLLFLIVTSCIYKNVYHLEEDSRNLNEDGTSIKDTVVIDNKNSKFGNKGPCTDDFEYVKWSKNEGLIEYRLRDGTVYSK